MRDFVVLVDCDGVLANSDRLFSVACNEANGTNFTEADAARAWDITKGLNISEEQTTRMFQVLNQPGQARSMAPLPGAIEGMKKILACQGLQVAICTSPMRTSPTWCYDRKGWLEDHLGDIPVIFAREKWLCQGDLLVDDHYDNVKAWVEQGPPGAHAVWWTRDPSRPLPPRTEAYQDWERLLLRCCL